MLKITKKDLEWAASRGALQSTQIDLLWSTLHERPHTRSRFDLMHVIYYFGALLIIFGMAWFTNEAWEQVGAWALFVLATGYVILFSFLGQFLWFKKRLEIPGGLLTVAAVCLVPLMIFAFQKGVGLWPQGDPGVYRNYHLWVKGSWFFLELGTIIAGLIALRFIPFPFLTAPIFFSLWYMSMDLTPLLFGKSYYSQDEAKWVSVIFGLIMLIATYFIDRRTQKDFAFWGYLFGMLSFWGGLTLLDSSNEFGKFIYFMINIFFVFISVLFARKVFIVFGAIGCLAYLGHLSSKVFKDFLSFPIVVSLVGLAIIFLGIQYQKNKTKIDQKILSFIPSGIKNLSPLNRVR